MVMWKNIPVGGEVIASDITQNESMTDDCSGTYSAEKGFSGTAPMRLALSDIRRLFKMEIIYGGLIYLVDYFSQPSSTSQHRRLR